jgi:Hemerythrin HHE cation binding domain
MSGVLYQYLSNDHETLDRILEKATAKPGTVDMESYADFRKRLLRHISIEEKIVFPAIARWQGGRKAPMVDQLHLDHGAIVALMVPPPNPSIILTLKSVFAVHNPIEEDTDGLYDLFEALAGPETDRMLEELKTAPAVPVLPHNPKPELLELAKQALARAGHEFKEA